MEELRLYHGTSSKRLHGILSQGAVKSPSFWGGPEIAGHFAEKAAVEDGEDAEPVVFEVELSRFQVEALQPDQNGIDANYGAQPEIDEMWESSDRSWRACLEIFDCLMVTAQVPVSIEDLEEVPEEAEISDFREQASP